MLVRGLSVGRMSREGESGKVVERVIGVVWEGVKRVFILEFSNRGRGTKLLGWDWKELIELDQDISWSGKGLLTPRIIFHPLSIFSFVRFFFLFVCGHRHLRLGDTQWVQSWCSNNQAPKLKNQASNSLVIGFYGGAWGEKDSNSGFASPSSALWSTTQSNHMDYT